MIEIKYTSPIEELLEIPELHPQPARNFVPDWYKRTPATLNKTEENDGWKYKKLIPSYRTVKTCPSFHDVFAEGLVLVSPCDIHIWLDDDNENAEWKVAITHKRIFIDIHHDKQWLDYYDGHKVRKVFKLSSPWYFQLPKGYGLRQIPYMYANHEEWVVPYGVVNSDVYSELNPQILFTSKSNEILIKKGEPLCYLVPFKREKSKATLLTGKQRDKLIHRHAVEGYKINNSFRSGYYTLGE